MGKGGHNLNSNNSQIIPLTEVPYVTRYNSIDELYAHKQRKHWAERAAEVSVLNFDFYVKRTMTNPIATLYNRIHSSREHRFRIF